MRPLKFTEHVSCLISFVIKQEITICQEIPVFPAPWGGKSRAISQYTGRRAGQYQDAYLTNIDAEGQRAERGTFFPIHCPALCQLPKLLSLLHPFPTNFSFFLELKEKMSVLTIKNLSLCLTSLFFLNMIGINLKLRNYLGTVGHIS